MSAPALSVVVPTHDRRASVERLLDRLGAQTLAPERFEAIVVADGCRDDTVERLRSAKTPFAIEVLEQPGTGAAAARSEGAKRARGAVLVFLDDDMEPAPGWLAAHAAAHEAGADRVVLGPAIPTFDDAGFFGLALRAWWHDLFAEMARPGHRFGYRDLLTGNLSLPADLLRRAGDFDRSLACREDYELGIRLLAAGAELRFVPEAAARHHDTPDVDRSLRRARAEGAADVAIARRHAAIRPTLELSRFHRASPRLRLLRRLAFRSPRVGEAWAAALRRALDRLERVRARRQWRATYGAARDFWYWRGAAEALGSRRALDDLLAGSGAMPETEAELEIDLRAGLAEAERLLDARRPASARLRYGRVTVGDLPAEPGAEPLRGAHLRPALAEELAGPLVAALATETAADPSARAAL